MIRKVPHEIHVALAEAREAHRTGRISDQQFNAIVEELLRQVEAVKA